MNVGDGVSRNPRTIFAVLAFDRCSKERVIGDGELDWCDHAAVVVKVVEVGTEKSGVVVVVCVGDLQARKGTFPDPPLAPLADGSCSCGKMWHHAGDGVVVAEAALVDVACTGRVGVGWRLDDSTVWTLAAWVVGARLAVGVDRENSKASRSVETVHIRR